MQRPPSPKHSQLRTRGWSQPCGIFHYSTLEMSYKCHDSGHNTNLTYGPAHRSRDAQHTATVDSVGKLFNHYGYADSRALQLEHFIDHRINSYLSDDQYQQVYNPNLAFNHQVTAPPTN